MNSICKKCRKNINNFCKVSGEPVNKNRHKCSKYKPIYKQNALFEALGNEKY